MNYKMNSEMEIICQNLDNSLIYDPEQEYTILKYSQSYSLEELNLARETVINSSITRYGRYLKYIKFDVDDTSKYIKSLILEFLSCKKNEKKISSIIEIDRLLICYVDEL